MEPRWVNSIRDRSIHGSSTNEQTHDAERLGHEGQGLFWMEVTDEKGDAATMTQGGINLGEARATASKH